jgi:branched-chain amino acid transport system ATP-binding protein
MDTEFGDRDGGASLPRSEVARSLLLVDGVRAGYQGVTALWDVSFSVAEGQVVTLLGSNGAGKTTTLRTISGLLTAISGSIVFEGRDITRARTDQIVELGIVHVPEGRQLWPRMSVRENLELGAYLPRAKARRAESLARVFGLFPRLKERRNQAAGTLSGGERQMCALARGLMGLPRLLMLDEPSLGLAPRLVSEMFDSLRSLRDEGLTVLLVEQNVHQALELADVGYVLETGRIVLGGSSSDLLASPLVRSAYLGVANRACEAGTS